MGAGVAPFTKNETALDQAGQIHRDSRVKLTAPILMNPRADPQRKRTSCKKSEKTAYYSLTSKNSLPISRQASQSTLGDHRHRGNAVETNTQKQSVSSPKKSKQTTATSDRRQRKGTGLKAPQFQTSRTGQKLGWKKFKKYRVR